MATDYSKDFLHEVLGTAGAQALLKAVTRSPALASVLVPRAIIGWTMSAAAWGYSGEMPGVPNFGITFRKSETLGLYSGEITDGLTTTSFVDSTLYRVAAHVAVALGSEPGPIAAGVKDLDLERLGKSIDTLAKAQLLAQATMPTLMSSHGDIDVFHAGSGATPYSLRRRKDNRVIIDHVPTLADAQKLAAQHSAVVAPPTEPMDKVEPPGQTHKPTPQQGPQGAAAPQMQPRQAQAQTPKADAKGPGVKAPPRTDNTVEGLDKPPEVKLPKMKVGKSEAHGSRCGLCQQTQFQPDGSLMGCLCFRAVVADIVVKAEPDHYELTFGPTWDADARAALLEALRPSE